jgi:Domain of unknown function (DUF1707)
LVYVSEGGGFESLRARQVTGLSPPDEANTRPWTPQASLSATRSASWRALCLVRERPADQTEQRQIRRRDRAPGELTGVKSCTFHFECEQVLVQVIEQDTTFAGTLNLALARVIIGIGPHVGIDRRPAPPHALSDAGAREDGRQEAAALPCPCFVLTGEVPVMAGPGDEMSAAAGRGHLRASHADREQVIDTLKVAFVQGRLAKDELDLRVGQAFAARTYADLAAVTADLPAGLTGVRPPGKAVRARARRPIGKVVLAGTSVIIPPAMLAAGVLTEDHRLAKLSMLLVVIVLLAWMGVTGRMLVSRDERRSGGQLPPGPGRRGRTLEGERDGSRGDDLILCEARSGIRPPHEPRDKAIRRTRRSRPVRGDRRPSVALETAL